MFCSCIKRQTERQAGRQADQQMLITALPHSTGDKILVYDKICSEQIDKKNLLDL